MFVVKQMDQTVRATINVKSVDLLMSIEWGRLAQDDVSKETIVKCFKRTWLYPNEVDEQDASFEGEKLPVLQELVTAMEVSCIAEEFFLAVEDEIQICSGFFDPADPKRRENGQEKKF